VPDGSLDEEKTRPTRAEPESSGARDRATKTRIPTANRRLRAKRAAEKSTTDETSPRDLAQPLQQLGSKSQRTGTWRGFQKHRRKKAKSNRPKIEKYEERLRWASELHRLQKRHGNEKSVASFHSCAEIESSRTKVLSKGLNQKRANQPRKISDPAKGKLNTIEQDAKTSLSIKINARFKQSWMSPSSSLI
jgi:hypothetical protein